MRRACSSGRPWEKLRRTTSTPARIIAVRTFGSSVAGPSVVTILVRRCMSPRPFFEYRDRGKRLAFHEFEKCPTAGGDIGDAVLHAVLLDRRERIAAARERERRAARDGVRERARALAELIELEHAHRPVPYD